MEFYPQGTSPILLLQPRQLLHSGINLSLNSSSLFSTNMDSILLISPSSLRAISLWISGNRQNGARFLTKIPHERPQSGSWQSPFSPLKPREPGVHCLHVSLSVSAVFTSKLPFEQHSRLCVQNLKACPSRVQNSSAFLLHNSHDGLKATQAYHRNDPKS